MCTFQLSQLSAHNFSSDYIYHLSIYLSIYIYMHISQGWEIQAKYTDFVKVRRQSFYLKEAEEAGLCGRVLERRELCKERAPQIYIEVL